MVEFVDVFKNMDLGVAVCVLAIALWFINDLIHREREENIKREERSRNDHIKREDRLIEVIEKFSDSLDRNTDAIVDGNNTNKELLNNNKELSETNRLLADKIDGKLGDINVNIGKIFDKIDK